MSFPGDTTRLPASVTVPSASSAPVSEGESVADDDVLATDFEDHLRGKLAGERAFLLVVAVLRAEFDAGPLSAKEINLKLRELMSQGKINLYFCQGFNPLLSAPNRAKLTTSLSKLKFLVVMDPLQTETSRFWENHGEFNVNDPAKVQTEVFELPTTCFAEESGSLTNSGRWLQWHFKGADAPGEAKSDQEIIGELFVALRELYKKDAGKGAEPILNLSWPYRDPKNPTPEELAKEMNGRALADLFDPKDPTKQLAKKGEQLPGFALLRDDGSTMSACWIFSGCWTQAGNQMSRRDNTDVGLGNTPGWAWAWPWPSCCCCSCGAYGPRS